MSQHRWWKVAVSATVVAALSLSPSTSQADDRPVQLGNLSDFIGTPKAQPSRTWQTGQWFVEFDAQPTASGGRTAQIQRNRADFTAEANAARLPAQVDKVYSQLFNGATVTADEAQARKLAGLRSVKAVHPVLGMHLPQAPVSATNPAAATLAMIGADRAQAEMGLTGTGVKVGIIDSGIDYSHPDLGGTGDPDTTAFPTQRITHGWDFIGNSWSAYDGDTTDSMTPNPDPMDCMGHGTHVAGTVAADGEVTGVAPQATLGAYKVLTCGGETTMDVVLEAMERATADGMDVVNMSLGWPMQGSQHHPLSQAADRMVDAGVVLVVAAGNEGEYGTQTLRAPAVARKAIAVAAFDATSVATPEILFTPAGGEPISAGFMTLSDTPLPTGFTGELATFTDALQCRLDPTLAGKVVFFAGDGGCDIERRTQLAIESGALGIVLHREAFFWDWLDTGDVPAVGILSDAAAPLQDALRQGPVTVTVPGTYVDTPNPYTPGLVSPFSSWGLDTQLGLKPDLGAPGESVYSTLPGDMGGHGLNSGTSMASPHVAGAAALLLQSNPAYSADDIRVRLQNTAIPAVFSFMPDAGVLDAAHRQGAGIIRVDRAVTQDSLITPSKLSAGQSADGALRQRLTITNPTDAPITWTASHDDAVTTSVAWAEGRLQNQPDFTQEQASIAFSAATITVPAQDSAVVDVTIDAPDEAAATAVYSGFLHFTSNDGQSLRVPFAGFKGDYSDAPTLLGNDSPYPPYLGALLECVQTSGRQCTDDFPAFTDVDGSEPYEEWMMPAVAFTLATPASSITVSVLEADRNGKPVAATEQQVYTEREPWRSIDTNVAAWDGLLLKDGELVPAPHGSYVLRIKVTNADTPSRTETWTSPAFTWLSAEEPEPEPTKKPTHSPKPAVVSDVYNTPGLHHVNGRHWFTACEPYSQTTRCRTMINATQVSYAGGVFTQSSGWVFNNLTYLPKMTRAAWGTNPLAVTGTWEGADGRLWRTECDTAATGRGGCRTYLTASVIEAQTAAGGGTEFVWVSKEVLNNIVRFER